MQLAQYLEQRGISVAAFADRLGVDVSTVYRWCSGDRVPSVDAFRRIKSATGGAVTPNDFICCCGEPAA